MTSRIPLLMTGASGLVGSRIVELLNDQYEVFNMDLTTGVDITREETLVNFVKSHQDAKTMIHLAAFTNTGEAFKQQGDREGICYKVNVLGTKNIARVCKDNDIHLIHISTDFVFDGNKTEPYTEEDPRSPIEWYGETKALAEVEVEQSGSSYAIVRIAYPYRANFTAKPDLVQKILLGLETGTLYPQFTDTEITPTLIDDIAIGLTEIIESSATGIFHLVGSTSLSPYELSRLVAKTFGYDESLVKEGSLTSYLEKSPRPFARHAKISNDKFFKTFGMKPKTIEEGLQIIKDQKSALQSAMIKV